MLCILNNNCQIVKYNYRGKDKKIIEATNLLNQEIRNKDKISPKNLESQKTPTIPKKDIFKEVNKTLPTDSSTHDSLNKY
jgi:aminoglycoside N3'-acetyltransferase